MTDQPLAKKRNYTQITMSRAEYEPTTRGYAGPRTARPPEPVRQPLTDLKTE
jgi:hypothetical protein